MAWSALAFWAFSFSYSSSFFSYHRPSRLPIFAAAFVAAVAIPTSGVVQWLRVRRGATTRLRGWLGHAVVTLLCLGGFMLVAAVLANAPAPFKPSADDAMGTGIDYLMLLGLALACGVAVTVALAVTKPAGARS